MSRASPAPKRPKLARAPYSYKKIQDLQPNDDKVNIMGVISLFKPPYKSRGADYTCTIEIVDEGCSTNPFPCIFFNRDMDKLPQSCSVGDVLCVRRVEVGEFNQRLQGKCRRYCSWLVWDGEREEGRPPVTHSEGSSWDSVEVQRAVQLVRWNASRDLDSQLSMPHPPTTASPRKPALKPITSLSLADRKIDFVGVIKTSSVPQKSKGPDYFTTCTLIDETSPVDGIPFTFFNPKENQLPKLGQPGTVAYLQSMELSDYQGTLQGRGHERSRVVCFSMQPDGTVKSSSSTEVTPEVMQRIEALLEWVVSAQPLLGSAGDPHQPHPPSSATPTHSLPRESETDLNPPAFLTLTFHPTWEISSVESVKSCSKVPSCFRARVKVLQVLQPLEQCCQLRCPQCKFKFPPTHEAGSFCANCRRRGKTALPKLRFMFCLTLLVRDVSASVPLHLSDTDADDFFQELEPVNLHDNPSTRETLLRVLYSLTGGHDPFLPLPSSSLSSPSSSSPQKCRPWVDCCIQSYPSSKGTQYRIVDTWYVRQDV